MKQFNPRQYLAIDIANNFGLDKLDFEDRIDWVKTNLDKLESLVIDAEEPELYMRAVMAFRDSYSKPIGHPVALDSCSSGLQLMSVLTRCKKGLSLTGLNGNHRVDAYTELTKAMNEKLGTEVSVTRKQAKSAIMTFLYGSEAVPEAVFGDLVDKFYETVQEQCTGAYELLEVLLNTWDKNALYHAWYMPDGHYVYIPVMATTTKRIELKDWEYQPSALFKENQPVKYRKSNAANAIHSVDAYVLRTLVRRCNYHKPTVLKALESLNNASTSSQEADTELSINKRWYYTRMADIAHLEQITAKSEYLDKELRNELIRILTDMLNHEPFDIICIHDSFAVNANHCNQLRYHYHEILAELSDSTVLDDILAQLFGYRDIYERPNESVADLIRQSGYGLS